MSNQPRQELTLFDSTCLIVGIIIGVGIYQTAPDVARGAGTTWGVLSLWIAGGLLSLCGAMGYAELASAFPQEGGDYVYLTHAYGRWAGFLFGWVQLAAVRPGLIASLAFAFATYARALYEPFPSASPDCRQAFYSTAAAVGLTLVNVIGVREGKLAQNLLTVVKALGLLAIVSVALLGPRQPSVTQVHGEFPFSVALILVLFTYGGWNEMAYVAAEVRDPRRNIVRALMLGIAAVTAIYVLVNVAFLYALGYSGLSSSSAVAVGAVSSVFPTSGGRLIAALICVSTLGAINGLIFTGARISYAVGTEHRAFRWLGRWHPRRGTPANALLLQGAIAVGLILLLGSFVDTVLYTAACVYSFYLATSLAVIVLRYRQPHIDRPYSVSGYPVPTVVFMAVCCFLIYGAVGYRPWIAAASAVILLLGLPIYWLSSRGGREGGT